MGYTVIDITKELIGAKTYPGDPKPELSVFSSLAHGDSCNMAYIRTTLHAGTHADAALHFMPNGTDMAGTSLNPFIGECTVIEVNTECITGEYVDNYFPRSAQRLLIKSGGKAYFDKTGAEEAAYYGIKLIGTDNLSVGSHHDQTGPHRAFLGEGVSILEGLDLSKVNPGRYFLVAPPLKIAGVDGSPVRALLISGYIFWSN